MRSGTELASYPERLRSFALMLAMACLLAGCGSGREAVPTKLADVEGLAGSRVVLMPPDIELHAVYSGRFPELNADWTTQGRDHVVGILDRWLARRQIEVALAEELEGDSRQDTNEDQLVRLHDAIAGGILANHFETFGRLPTKEARFEWSLGSEARLLAERYGADYALFVKLRDNYPSAGSSGSETANVAEAYSLWAWERFRAGYASLVELESGRVVWFARRDRRSPGLRTRWNARDDIEALFEDFPE